MKKLSHNIHKLIFFSKAIHFVSGIRFSGRCEGADQFNV